jgi:hypothetical protein
MNKRLNIQASFQTAAETRPVISEHLFQTGFEVDAYVQFGWLFVTGHTNPRLLHTSVGKHGLLSLRAA